MPDLLIQGLKAFKKNITLYNKLIDQKKHKVLIANGEQVFNEEVQEFQASELQELEKDNERINEMFNIIQELTFIVTDQRF